MKVAVLTGPGKLEFQEKPIPKALAAEAVVKIEYCGICGSDVHCYRDALLFPPGTVLGHEITGVISEAGEKVERFKVGDRVVVRPSAECGQCFWCQNGEISVCPNRRLRAIGQQPGKDGGFAEFVKIEYPDQMLFKLPDHVSLKDAALIEPMAVSLHAIRSSRLKPGDRVVVIGAGLIGLLVIQFLKLSGAGRIIALEISETKAKLAQEMGANIVLNPLSEKDMKGKIFSLTDGTGGDIVYECAGVPVALQSAIEYVRRRGQILVVGVHEKDVPLSLLKMLLWEIEMQAVLGNADEFKYVIEFLEQGRMNTKHLISDVIPLSALEEKGMKRLLSSPDLVKILLQP